MLDLWNFSATGYEGAYLHVEIRRDGRESCVKITGCLVWSMTRSLGFCFIVLLLIGE